MSKPSNSCDREEEREDVEFDSQVKESTAEEGAGDSMPGGTALLLKFRASKLERE